MKNRLIIPAAVLVLICSAAFISQGFMKIDRNRNADEQGHVLSSLWKTYYAAEKADQPKKMAESLEAIKKEAKARRYHWDFYDAALKKVDAETSRNWKLRQELRSKLAAEIEEYDEPIVTYSYRNDWGGERLTDYVLTNRTRLQSGRNKWFYTRTSGQMNNLLNDFIKDDYEYALWSERYDGRDSDKATTALKDLLGDTYPNAAWLEYSQLMEKYWLEREDALKAFIDKYYGKAVGLFGKAMLFQDRMTKLSTDEAGEDAYKALYADIKAAEKERKSYTSGVDSKIAASIDDFKYQLENLERKEISVSFQGREVIVALRNLDKVEVSITPDVKDASPLVKQTLLNPRKSFYVLDTVKLTIPDCDDGDYVVKAWNGKIVGEGHYMPKTLSLAMRDDAEGRKFYVADYLTGEPLKTVDLRLMLSGKEVAKATGVAVEGFTPLPEAVSKAVTRSSYYYLEASYREAGGRLRKSKELGLNNFVEIQPRKVRNDVYCNIFTDKSAYNPGETVKFKAVLYRGDLRESIHVLPTGEKVDARLVNAEGKEVATVTLKTNEYGSVAGEFLIPKGERNGHFSLEVSHEKMVSSRSLVVDEFILPTYDLTFESVDSLFFMGDEIEVRGKLSSYSGHPLDAAEVTYVVDSRGTRVSEGSVAPASDGSFSIRFPSRQDFYWYNLVVRVKDASGETKEFSRSVFVLNYYHIDLSLDNSVSGDVCLASDRRGTCSLISADKAEVTFVARNNEGRPVPVPISYELKDASGKVVESGSLTSGDSKVFEVSAPGLYNLVANSVVKAPDGKEITAKSEISFLKVVDSDEVLAATVENFFKPVGPCADGSLKDGEEIKIQMGAGEGPVWAVAELFGDLRQPFGRRLIHLDGVPGKSGSIETIAFEYKKDYPDAVWMSIFYFRKGSHFQYHKEFRREKTVLDLPLSFSSFEDKALPGKEYSFVLESLPGAEAVAAVFDKSSETISPNRWSIVRLTDVGAMNVYYQVQDGSVDRYGAYGISGGGRMFKTRAAGVVMEEAMEMNSMVAMAAPKSADSRILYDEVTDEDGIMSKEDAEAVVDDVAVRSDFSTSLAFEPFLRTDENGCATLKFRTSDKLSTFVVQVYAHTKDMKNALVRQEMTVSVPVKVSVAEPKYLYKGDKYVLHAVVSSLSDKPVQGTVTLQCYPSSDYEGVRPFASSSKKVNVPAGGSVPVEFDVNPGKYEELGLKVVFADSGKTFSDAVFVSLPVLEAEQTLTESHSAVLLAGMDKDTLLRRLQSEFTGTSSKGAEYKEIDIRQMLLDAIPSKVEPAGKDVLSLTESNYVRKVAAKLGSKLETVMPDAELWAKITSCRNADGGFGWFEGMKSSPVITAVVLERFAKLRDAGLGTDGFDPASSVAYLDRNQFIHGGSWPWWCGWLSMEQYAHVRSMFASVPFDVSRETASEKSEYSKNFKEFKKDIKDYLVPSAKDGRGLNGQILAKARRIKTLVNLVYGEGGTALASAWGIKFNADSKMKSSIAADIASLDEYAVEHRDGGWYYPNAVMPWRGLLESELYAHSLLCDLLSDSRVSRSLTSSRSLSGVEGKIADGIRIWIMLQKETQKWADDPAYVDAINSVMNGGDDVLSTRVILLTKTYRKPFSDIVSAGNGFTIERHFYKEVLGEDAKVGRVEIYPGMILKVGDKIISEYKVWNQENRSFVKLTAPREAGFRPVNQLSGHIGWWSRPVGGTYSVTPQGYRNVKTDCTEYFFDVYPEESTTVTEEFFITQEGEFTAPVVTIESLYAPHYRANDKFGGRIILRN